MPNAAVPGRPRGAAAAAAGAAAVLAVAFTPMSAAQDVVYIEGVNVESQTAADGGANGFGGAQSGLDREQLCSADGRLAIGGAVEALAARMAPLLSAAGVDADGLASDAGYGALAALDEFCDGDGLSLGLFRIVYAECRMTMYQGDAVVDMRLPPGRDEAYFDLIDYAGQRVVRQPVDVAAILTSTAAAGSPSGSLTATGRSEVYETRFLSEPTREYAFDTSFVMNLGAMMAAAAGPGEQPTAQELAMVSQIIGTPVIKSTGTAWIAPDAPGAATVRAFYESFAAVLSSGQGSTALLSGLFNHFLLREGLPLRMEQTTELEMAGLGALGPGASFFPAGQTSRTAIDRILVTSMPSGYCAQSIAPPEFEVLNPLAELQSDARSGQGAAPGVAEGPPAAAPSGADLGAALSALNAATQNMTDEQKAAMQQFGALLGGAAAQSGAEAGPGAAAANAAAPTRAASGPSSAELMTGDLTESAQKLLGALGYDPGPADGELGTATMIAISQFQAEQGLEVTGEVTPQLVGILAAEVDKR